MRAFRLAYDGTDYRGFQRQPHGKTVENAVFEALTALDVPFEDGRPIGYAAAGRTDAGVSARAQTVAFETPAWLKPRAFNGELPADVRAWASADASAGFHATHDATERVYRYFLYAPGQRVDDDRAAEACRRLSGDHDFRNLTPDDEGTRRELSVTIEREGPFFVCEFRAGGFARELVRRLVSLVESIATGDCGIEFLECVLGPEPLSGPDGVSPVAPEPLVLADVRYPDLGFEIDEVAAESTRDIFESRCRRRLAGARVAGTLAEPRTGRREPDDY